MINAVRDGDPAVVQGVVLTIAVGFVVVNLVVDVLYLLVNPRLRSAALMRARTRPRRLSRAGHRLQAAAAGCRGSPSRSSRWSILAAVLAPLLTPHDTRRRQEDAGGGPSATHWMGLDSANRDIFTRLVYGARWSLVIGLGATALALVAGALIGAVAATSRKAVDETVMRAPRRRDGVPRASRWPPSWSRCSAAASRSS